jgi:LPXTG-motif cell wall-anchored protein
MAAVRNGTALSSRLLSGTVGCVSRLTIARGACQAVSRREQTPACTVVSLQLGVGVILTARAPDRRRSSRAAMTQGRARQTYGENMDTTTLLVIVLVVLLLGGGGFFYRRRV